MSGSAEQKLSLPALSAMVVGSMVGAGIFSLPQTFGHATGGLGALVAWTIAGFGTLMLALVFQTLSMRKPDLDSGIYAYAKAGFGNYPGFASALGYWTVGCLGNVSYFVLIKSTLGAIFPIFGDGNTVPAVAVSSVILWTVHFMILRGVRQAASLNTIVTVAKIIPILIFLVFVAVGFKADIFAANFWGGETASFGSIFAQVRGTMLVTVFVFVGIEGASVYSRYARDRRDVGLATVLGFLGVLCLLVLVTMLSYGVLLRPELANLRNPSMAGVLQAVVGRWGAVFVSVGLIISVLGAYLSWSLLAAEVLFSAARMKSMPSFLARENDNHVPAAALWLTNSLVQIFLILTLFAEQAFLLALKLTSSMILIPYLLVGAYAVKLAWTGETYAGEAKARSVDLTRAIIAAIYAAGLIYAGGLKYLLLSAIIYAPGTTLFFIARREQGQPVFTAVERGLFALALIGALAAIYGLAIGAITI
ncbi:arginine-ornithine antiporter [Kaistia dalseonensis]|uniref:Arginine-ornithine antiporter n=1 Tax=Kaistia dalseonensis TaxID=410840 RepID=A0ABU0H5N5_9HYPH|nr:arginine-ornithine antiporter [Kaistia dalseonensis]MCX5494187.1 arginine-ornithine antiporter [Kaistia dalseonensis]MDQ0436766.1 arginine:ornithine antiporter/lysine permease [Kaistia dalseonensis]